MTDSLFARAQLAIEESRVLQRRSHGLRAKHDQEREKLRRNLFETAMLCSEMKANRDNKP